MKKHTSIHPLTKEKNIDNYNIDRIRYYMTKDFILDFIVAFSVMLLYALIDSFRYFMESIPTPVIIIIGIFVFIATYLLLFSAALPAVGKRYSKAIRITSPRHIMPIFITFCLSIFYNPLGIINVYNTLGDGLLHLIRLEIITGTIIISYTYYFIMKDRFNYKSA